MLEEMEEEYNQFSEDMKCGKTFCRYLDETEYEDNYSHNEIDKYQTEFIEKASEYLHKYFPGIYIISSGWCVFVMTVEEAKERNVYLYEHYIVK